jgi:hypothetical protein
MWVAIQLQVDSLLHEQMTIRAEWFRSRKLLVAGCRGGIMAGRGNQGAPTPPWLAAKVRIPNAEPAVKLPQAWRRLEMRLLEASLIMTIDAPDRPERFWAIHRLRRKTLEAAL